MQKKASKESQPTKTTTTTTLKRHRMSDQQKIDISKLEPEQIMQFRKQFQEEVEHFSTSFNALSVALSKYEDCVSNITRISSKENDGKEILVSLSTSLYVPGKVKDNNKFLVDIGTGYYVEKSAEDARMFYQQKITQLNKDSEKVTQIIREKSDVVQRMDEILRQKMQLREKQSS